MTRPDWKDRFFMSLRKNGNVAKAARFAGVTRARVYQLKDSDVEFEDRWHEVMEARWDDLEEACYRRAKRMSDRLMIFMLTNQRADVYKDTIRNEHTGADGGPINLSVMAESLDSRLASLAARNDPSAGDWEHDGAGEGDLPVRLAALGAGEPALAGRGLEGLAALGGERVREDEDGG